MSQKQIGSGLQVIGAVALVCAAFVFGGVGLALLALAVVCLVFGIAIEHEAVPATSAVVPEDLTDVAREKPGEV